MSTPNATHTSRSVMSGTKNRLDIDIRVVKSPSANPMPIEYLGSTLDENRGL